VASIRVDAETNLAVIMASAGRRLSVQELNAALDLSPYRVTGLDLKS
jgi:hypothetical protein